MNSINISDLVRAVATFVLLSMAVGQYKKVRNFAIKEGVKAITLSGYKPTYFFGK